MATVPAITGSSRQVPRRSKPKPQPDIVRRFLALTTPIGAVEAKPMFGGYGFYFEGMIFALEAYGKIWLKADMETRARFEAAGCEPFLYEGRTRTVEMPYWTIPEEAMRGGAPLKRWVGLSLDVARRASARKRPAVRRRSRPEPDFI
jgi:DNA transformation protein